MTAAFLILAAASAQAPPTLTAEQAMAHYRAALGVRTPDQPVARCGSGAGEEIVVCGKGDSNPARLPMREDRFAPGEVVRHRDEVPSAVGALNSKGCGTGGCGGDASKMGETLHNIWSRLKGEDPD
jgi:hypothetical protein